MNLWILVVDYLRRFGKRVVSMRGICVRFAFPPVEAGLKSGLITRQNAGTTSLRPMGMDVEACHVNTGSCSVGIVCMYRLCPTLKPDQLFVQLSYRPVLLLKYRDDLDLMEWSVHVADEKVMTYAYHRTSIALAGGLFRSSR